MTDSNRVSRRSWFRLRKTRPAVTPAPSTRQMAVGAQSAGLTELQHPPNHDGMDLSELPPMREALLDVQQTEELFGDIEACGKDILLMQRATRSARASVAHTETKERLQAARAALLDGKIARVQIRYRWDGHLWIDTLETKPEGYRLIRIAHTGK